jgi:hypothetical protein
MIVLEALDALHCGKKYRLAALVVVTVVAVVEYIVTLVLVVVVSA